MAKRKTIDQWERSWQKHWAKAGTTYELPAAQARERKAASIATRGGLS
jgi:hypothetical protein